MESGSKIVSANVNAVPSCELATSYSHNSLPGGSSILVLGNHYQASALWR